MLQFELSDIISVSLFIGGLITVYVNLKKELVQLVSNAESDRRQSALDRENIKDLQNAVNKENLARHEETKDFWIKLSNLEKSQLQTNIYLQENLKHLMELIKKHDKSIDYLSELTREHDNVMSELKHKN